MIETAIALAVVVPLAGTVFSGIAGGVAYAKFKRLWDLPRRDVDDVEVALVQAALQAVIDLHKRALTEETRRLTEDEKRVVKERIKEFKKTHDALRWEDTGYAQQKLSEWAEKAPGTGDTRGGQYGPLVAYACTDIPPALRDALRDDFAPGLRVHFHRKLRDSDVLFRVFTVEILTEFREIIEWWRNLDPQREAKLVEQVARMGEGVSLLIKKFVEFEGKVNTLDAKVDELPERIRPVVLGCLEQVQRQPAHLSTIIEQLPTILTLATDRGATTQAVKDPRDLLKSYPEPQRHWVGRLQERGGITTAWRSGAKQVYAVVGFGGQGKSALARRFTETLRRQEHANDRPLVIWWSFYLNRAADEFFDQAARPLNIPLIDDETKRRRNSEQIAQDIIERMRTGVDGRRVLLVLDGLEVLQDTTTGREGRLKDVALYGLLKGTLDDNNPDTDASGMVLITTREPLTDLTPDDYRPFTSVTLDQLSVTDGTDLLINHYGLNIDRNEAGAFVDEVAGHALTLTLTGSLLRKSGATSATVQELREFIASEEARVTDRDVTTRTHRLPGYVLRHCGEALDPEHRQVMRLLSCCVRPATRRDVEEILLQPIGETDEVERVNDKLMGRAYTDVRNGLIRHLCELHLIDGNEEVGYDMHPLIRRHFYEEETGEGKLTETQRKAVHARFFTVLPERQPKHHPRTMTEMEPLIDAVLHGCRAGLTQRALDDLYHTRIERRDTGRTTGYLSADLGASETKLQLLRAFFPDGDLNADPQVSIEGDKAYLISAVGLALMSTGRPSDAIPLFERGAEMRFLQSDWVNRSADFQNLSELHDYLGRLPAAFEVAKDALADLDKVRASHPANTPFTIFSYGLAAWAAAQRGQDPTAAKHFERAIDLHTVDWLWSLIGAWQCTWLARSGEFEPARMAGEKNAAWGAEHGSLLERTGALASQSLTERLAWAAGDSERKTLDEMERFAERAVEVGKRSGHHYYNTCALLEAGRCAAARAAYEGDRCDEHVARAKRHLTEAGSRADYAGYCIIHADIHVTRAQLARLAGDTQTMRKQCEAAIDICDDPTCDYAWAKEDALALLAGTNLET